MPLVWAMASGHKPWKLVTDAMMPLEAGYFWYSVVVPVDCQP